MEEFDFDNLITEARSVKHDINTLYIVDDSYFAIDHFYHIAHIIDPSIEVLFARRTDEAKGRFLEKQNDIDLVLMDYRLEDAASGPWLTRNFLIIKPHLTILANSAMKEYNQTLLDEGCVSIIGKKIPAFFQWWIEFHKTP